MIAVLARLQWLTLRGRVVRSLRLLRQPKYLVGSLVGFAWMGMWILRPILHSRVTVARPWSQPDAGLNPTFHHLAALAVTVVLPLSWLLPWGRLGLPFRESELTMLLQAPLTRRQVIQYGLLKSEVGVVVSAFALSWFLAGGAGPGAWLAGFLGTWLLFEFWHLNGKWRALFNLRQTEIPAARARGRRFLLTTVLLVFYGVLLVALMAFQSQLGEVVRGADYQRVVGSLTALQWPPLLTRLLTPAWWLTAPMFQADGRTFLVAAIPTVLAVLAQRELILRSKARFEESSLEHAQAQETRKSPARRFRRVPSRVRTKHPFALASTGLPEVAVVWKNAVRVSRVPWRATAIGALILLAAIAVLPAGLRFGGAAYGVMAALGGILMVVLPLVGGMVWNNDLRTDLGYIELIRTWPVSARRFVLAEVVSPALVSFAGATFGAGLVLASLFGSRLRQALGGAPTGLVVLPRSGSVLGLDNAVAAVVLFASFLPMAAAASFVSSALQNLAALFAPAWMANSADRNQGVAAFGQRMVFSGALALAFLIALIPSAVLVGIALFAQHMIGVPWSAWEFPFWGALAAAPLFFGGWLIVQAAAPLWQRLDPSQEILEIGR